MPLSPDLESDNDSIDNLIDYSTYVRRAVLARFPNGQFTILSNRQGEQWVKALPDHQGTVQLYRANQYDRILSTYLLDHRGVELRVIDVPGRLMLPSDWVVKGQTCIVNPQ